MRKICWFYVAAFFLTVLVSQSAFAFTGNGDLSTELLVDNLKKVPVMASETISGEFLKDHVGLDQVADTPDKSMVVKAIEKTAGHAESPLLHVAQATNQSELSEEGAPGAIADPLEPINRAIFHFNDKFYFWLLKPAATGYKAITPRPIRAGVKNFFYNLAFPIRFINCLFQGKFEGAGNELTRFVINTFAGIAGFVDVAALKLELSSYDEDLGQSMGVYGIGHGFFINWPILGPSSLRDSFGLAGDGFLDPTNYISQTKYLISVKSYNGVNRTSLSIGEYEDLKKSALDPYIAVRDAYYQYRKSKVEE